MALATKHRPKKLSRIIGNKNVCAQLEKMLSRRRSEIPHTMLFHGPAGTGKTTLARIVARGLGCDFRIDGIERNAAHCRGIDDARELCEAANRAPMSSDIRVIILDECHQLTTAAQNCLLKSLEEPPPHAYFLLCTTEPEKLLNTVATRCTKFQTLSIADDEVVAGLRRICKRERIKLSDGILKEIADNSDGSMREALTILDSLRDVGDEKDIARMIVENKAKRDGAFNLFLALLKKKNWRAVLKTIDDAPETIRIVVARAASTYVMKRNMKAAAILEIFVEQPFIGPCAQAMLVLACLEVEAG